MKLTKEEIDTKLDEIFVEMFGELPEYRKKRLNNGLHPFEGDELYEEGKREFVSRIRSLIHQIVEEVINSVTEGMPCCGCKNDIKGQRQKLNELLEVEVRER